jgi:hypothetical protein
MPAPSVTSGDYTFPINVALLAFNDGSADPQPVTALNPVPVSAGGGTAGSPSGGVQSVQGFGYTGTATITRAANQTPYSIGDVVGGVITIANIGPSAGEIFLTALRLLWNISALPSGMGSFTWHIYNASPASAIADNSPWTLGSGDRGAYLCHIDGMTVAALGTGTASVQGQLSQLNEQLKLVAGTSLYAYLVTNAVYTPAANSETASLTAKSVAV